MDHRGERNDAIPAQERRVVWVVGLVFGLDFHFSVWVSVLQSTFMQVLLACGVCVCERESERERE